MKRLHPLGSARLAFLEERGQVVEPRQTEPLLPPELYRGPLLPEVDDALRWQCWELVRCEKGLDPSTQRGLFFLVAAALVAVRQGATRLPWGGAHEGAFADRLRRLGAGEEDVAAASALCQRGRSEASAVIGPQAAGRPLVVVGEQLYLLRLLRLEQELVSLFRQRLEPAAAAGAAASEEAGTAPSAGMSPEEAIRRVLEKSQVDASGTALLLSAEQQDALRKALGAPFTVISGGPGTGKTSIVVSILRALMLQGLSPQAVALAAPTGKAANRMAESIRKALLSTPDLLAEERALFEEPRPQTLHRLLGYSPTRDRFRFHAGNPLEARVVIVDEASMIDLGLMAHLVRAVHPAARLILLGDADQLPSVDAGAVLRDLIPPDDAPAEDPRWRAAARLRKSHRMDESDPLGRQILRTAGFVRSGDATPLFSGPYAIATPAAAAAVAFQGVELLPAGERAALLERWYEKLRVEVGLDEAASRTWTWEGGAFSDETALRALFDRFERYRILCVTRVEAGSGADAVNEALHRRHLEAQHAPWEVPFFPGEPVMVQRNDYERGLFNGDQGLVLRVRREGESAAGWRLVFRQGEGFALFPLDVLRGHVELSWAMTVHKSQGSEFDGVVVLLPEEEMPLLAREILYTALTRSRKSVVLVGERSIFEAGIVRRMERSSGIGEALARVEAPGGSGEPGHEDAGAA